MSATSAITLPARTIEVLDAPVTVRHAVDHTTPDGTFTAVVAAPVEEMTGENTYDDFYNSLVNRLIANCDAYLLSFRILGASEDGETLYVQVSNNMLELAAADPDILLEGGITEAEIHVLLTR